MSVIGTATKGWVGAKSAKGVAKNPKILKAGAKAGAPVAKFSWSVAKPRMKRRTRRRAEQMGDIIASAVTTAPQVAEQLGLVEPPKPKRTTPRLVAGMVIGAGAMYFLEPEHGRERREQVRSLVG